MATTTFTSIGRPRSSQGRRSHIEPLDLIGKQREKITGRCVKRHGTFVFSCWTEIFARAAVIEVALAADAQSGFVRLTVRSIEDASQVRAGPST